NYRRLLGITLQGLLPVRVVCLVPELIIGVARTYQEYGLSLVNPMFDVDTVWRISKSINIDPIEPWVQELTPAQIEILNGRKAGNRGRANRRGSLSSLEQTL